MELIFQLEETEDINKELRSEKYYEKNHSVCCDRRGVNFTGNT